MTAKERAEKILTRIAPNLDWGLENYEFVIAQIQEAERAAIDKMGWGQLQKESYEEGFAKGQEMRATCLCSTGQPCGMHLPMIEEATRERLAKLEAVAKAADGLIYHPRIEYRPGSKKQALRDALVALKGPDDKG